MENEKRIKKLRAVLVAMVSEHTHGSIPDNELNAQSDEVLIGEAALSFKVCQIALCAAQKKIEENGAIKKKYDELLAKFEGAK